MSEWEIQWAQILEMHWKMVQLSLHNNNNSDDYDAVFHTEGYGRGYVDCWPVLRAVQQQEERANTKAQTLKSRWGASTWSLESSMQGAAYTHACILYMIPQSIGSRVKSYIQWTGRVRLTSDFSILFWASTCVMISFMLVSRTIPPITISARMLWTWDK